MKNRIQGKKSLKFWEGFRVVFYCAHSFGGDPIKKNTAAKKIRKLQMHDKFNTYISPIHTFGFMYNDLSYEEGMELCYDLLTICDVLVVCSMPSKGVILEIEMAEKLDMPIIYSSKRLEVAVNEARKNGTTV